MTKHTVQDLENRDMRLDRYLRQQGLYFPQSLMEKWSRKKELLINDNKAKASSRVKAGDVITYPDHALSKEPPSTPSPLILTQDEAQAQLASMTLYEDDHILVLNKPPHLATQGGTQQKISVDDILRQASPLKRLRLTHRIDKETSGLLVVAKSSDAASLLTQAFRERAVFKTYLALCHGLFQDTVGEVTLSVTKGKLSSDLILSHTKEQDREEEKEALSRDEGQSAHTFYEVLRVVHDKECVASWVKLSPKTGRMHQLRIHMASIDHPIVGDEKYVHLWCAQHPDILQKQNLYQMSKKRMMLHAWKIELNLYGRDYAFEAPYPQGWLA